MIVGIGLDVCSIARMEEALSRYGDRFWKRILTEREQTLLAERVERATALAGRFAAKEAIVKAMSGAPGVGWHDLEVLGGLKEPPVMHVHGPARDLAQKMGVDHIWVSITHDAGIAAAVVILEKSGFAPRANAEGVS
ncbi:MAG: holo-ACP synthase [Polyangiaceae bacterium]|nr:holo-ACP synthase [Polyangiaceae bacterium]